jgi:hypothetical protein
MADNAMHPDIKAVILAYALGSGRVFCRNCAAGHPAVIQDFASSQD